MMRITMNDANWHEFLKITRKDYIQVMTENLSIAKDQLSNTRLHTSEVKDKLAESYSRLMSETRKVTNEMSRASEVRKKELSDEIKEKHNIFIKSVIEMQMKVTPSLDSTKAQKEEKEKQVAQLKEIRHHLEHGKEDDNEISKIKGPTPNIRKIKNFSKGMLSQIDKVIDGETQILEDLKKVVSLIEENKKAMNEKVQSASIIVVSQRINDNINSANNDIYSANNERFISPACTVPLLQRSDIYWNVLCDIMTGESKKRIQEKTERIQSLARSFAPIFTVLQTIHPKKSVNNERGETSTTNEAKLLEYKNTLLEIEKEIKVKEEEIRTLSEAQIITLELLCGVKLRVKGLNFVRRVRSESNWFGIKDDQAVLDKIEETRQAEEMIFNDSSRLIKNIMKCWHMYQGF